MTRRFAGIVTTIVGLGVVAVATLTPVRNDAPLVGAWWCLHCGPLALADAIANVVLFIPAGVGLALLSRRASPAVAGLALVSLAIELTQAWLIPGRDSSLRDVITNTIGGAVGIWLVRHWRVWLVPPSPVAIRLALVAAGTWAITLGATAALLQPLTPPGEYWGQRGSDSGFADAVIHVAVNGHAVPLGPLTDHSPVLAALNSEDVVVEVALARGAERIAGAVARVSNRRAEAFRLAHLGDDLVFSLRMRATDARLYTPLVRLRGGLPRAGGVTRERAALARDTLRVRASLRHGILRLELEGASAPASELVLAPTTGWAIFAPAELASPAPTWVLSGLWVAALLFPVGYWYWTATTRSVERDHGTDNAASAASALTFAVSAMVIGPLMLLPALTGTPWPPWWDWCAALVGATTGGWAASVVRACLALRP